MNYAPMHKIDMPDRRLEVRMKWAKRKLGKKSLVHPQSEKVWTPSYLGSDRPALCDRQAD